MHSVQLLPTQYLNVSNLKPVLFVLLLWCTIETRSQALPEAHIKQLSAQFYSAKEDSLKIEKLSELALYYYDYLGEKQIADSISQEAIEIARASYRPTLLLLAYNSYIENNDPARYLSKSLRYAQEAIKISKLINNSELEWRSYSNLAKVFLAGYKFDKALGSSYQALALADAIGNETLKAESYLLIGQSLEGNNQKIESFRNYLNATTIAEKIRKPALLKKCYSQLSGFYNNNKLFEKAIFYKSRQADLISQSLPVDSVELMWTQYDLQVISVNSNNNNLNTRSMQTALDFAIRTDHVRLKNYLIALYRTHLIEADKISELYNLYVVKYPAEFTSLYKENTSLYYRLRAYFNEEDKQADSAMFYLLQAEKLIHSDPNIILRSNFHQRFGQFLVRQGKPKDAIEKYLEAYKLASEASYFDYMLSSSKNLEKLYAGMMDYKNAYSYSELNQALSDSINILSKNDQLLMMEIDHESNQRELAAEHETIETHRRHNIQYTAITIITISMFILLLMLGSLKVPAWTIKMLGFFSFILLFEFIIMIADHKIYEITANEPWKILVIKIMLIAFLLPFHHWVEKKVIHFLISKKLIQIPKFSLSAMLSFKQKKSPEPFQAEENQ